MRAFLSCLGLLLWGCGGSPSGASPESAADESSRPASSSSKPRAASEASDGDALREERESSLSCDDGTCSVCGSGICPAGWYCDEKGGACSWLAECAVKPTCACVTRVLGSACKCDGSGAGLKVACD